MHIIKYYKKRNQRCPAKEFLEEDVEAEHQVLITNDVSRLAVLGNQARRPLAAHLEDGIYELRTRVIKNQYRLLYFFFDKNKIVITNGFKDHSRRSYRDEIATAKEYRQDYYDQQSEEDK